MRKGKLSAAVIFAAACLAGVPASGQVVDRVVAVVGSTVITLSDARAALDLGFLKPTTGDPVAEAVGYLVNRQLILGEVNRYAAPAPDQAAVDKRRSEVRGRFADEASFRSALEATAMTESRLHEFVSDNLRIESYLDQRFNAQAQPTPDEVERYYRDHPREFSGGGPAPAFEDVRERVQARVLAERRTALIADWLDRLRRRSIVRITDRSK